MDYYQDADLNESMSLLDIDQQSDNAAHGEIKVTTLVKIFKKMKFDTGESLGYGPVRLPETDMHTSAMWITLPPQFTLHYTNDALQNGMMGVASLMRIVAPLYLMCSPRDLAVTYQVKSPFTDLPTLIVYDNCPGGIGLSEKAFLMRKMLVAHALELVRACPCESGCPSCAGPVNQIGPEGKAFSMQLLSAMAQLLTTAPEV